MVDLAEGVRRILDPVPPVTVAEAELTAGRRRRHRRWRAGAAASLVGAAAVIASIVISSPARTNHVTVGPAQTTTGSGGGPTAPLVPASKVKVTIRLDQSTVQAGTPLHGSATVDNRTGAPIDTGACSFARLIEAGLENSRLNVGPGVTQPLCRPSVKVPVGLSEYPVTVQTTFGACSQTPSGTSYSVPLCSGSLALPAGTYHVTVWLDDLNPTPTVTTPVVVTLTPAPNTAAAAPGVCTAVQLAVTGGWQGATQSMLGGVTLRNKSATPCTLQGWLGVSLAGSTGRTLDVKVRHPATAPSGFPQPPPGTPPAVTLRPGATSTAAVWIWMQWGNYCGLGSPNIVYAHLVLPDGAALPPFEMGSGTPFCDSPSTPSILDEGPIQASSS